MFKKKIKIRELAYTASSFLVEWYYYLLFRDRKVDKRLPFYSILVTLLYNERAKPTNYSLERMNEMKPCHECGKEQVYLLTSGNVLLCEECYYYEENDDE